MPNNDISMFFSIWSVYLCVSFCMYVRGGGPTHRPNNEKQKWRFWSMGVSEILCFLKWGCLIFLPDFSYFFQSLWITQLKHKWTWHYIARNIPMWNRMIRIQMLLKIGVNIERFLLFYRYKKNAEPNCWYFDIIVGICQIQRAINRALSQRRL